MTKFRSLQLSAWLSCLIALSVFYPLHSEALCLQKKSYNDCILEGLKGTSSDIAAQAIKLACADKFPSKTKKTLRLSSPSTIAMITGAISVQPGSLSGNLYNGSPFYLAGVTLSIKPKVIDISESKSLVRYLAIELNVPENTTNGFCISLDGAFENSIRNGFDWSVVDISVVKDQQ